MVLLSVVIYWMPFQWYFKTIKHKQEEKEAEVTIHFLHLRASRPEMIDVFVVYTHGPAQ